ncbi:MAG: hypothetical protein U0401_28850 [Anaerolineae bacterium]
MYAQARVTHNTPDGIAAAMLGLYTIFSINMESLGWGNFWKSMCRLSLG